MDVTGRILVVDDDPALAEAVTASLGRRYAVGCAGTGAEALTKICETCYDLILLDHRLPDLLGADLLPLIKRFFPATTVLFMTGQGSEEVAIDAFRGGARDYLKKPFSLQDLLARVDALFALRRQGGERRVTASTVPQDGRAADGRPGTDPDRSRSILRAVHHIEQHLDEPLTLDAVARIAGMSRFHFCRQFRKTTGASFRTFLLRTRIARAKELLRDSTRSIGDIAHEVGFRDLTHFGRVFQKFEEILPSEFRRGTVHASR